MYNCNETQDSPYDPTTLAIDSISHLLVDFISNRKKTIPFVDVVHFNDEQNIVTYVEFDGGFTFCPESPTKSDQINRERKNNSLSYEKHKCFPNNDQRNFSIDEEHTYYLFLKPYKIRNMDPAALMTLNYTNEGDFRSTQYRQKTTHQSGTDIIFGLLVIVTNRVLKEAIASQLCILQRTYFTDIRMIQTVFLLEELNDLREPEALDGIPAFVMICICI